MTTGRWPTNVILSPGSARILDGQSGHTRSVQGKPRGSAKPGEGWGMTATGAEYNDEGGASRFFVEAGYEPWEIQWIYEAGLRPCGTENI